MCCLEISREERDCIHRGTGTEQLEKYLGETARRLPINKHLEKCKYL